MAKITERIENYAALSVEEKLKALESLEVEDNAVELEKLRNAVSKANSESAEWKRKHNALLSEDEKAKQEQAERLAGMEKELNDLRKEKTVSEYTAKFANLGYDEALAKDTAAAMADGDMTKVFANQAKFNENYAKQIRKDELKNFPGGVNGRTDGNAEQDYGKLISEANSRGDYTAAAYYTRLQAQEQAQNNKQ